MKLTRKAFAKQRPIGKFLRRQRAIERAQTPSFRANEDKMTDSSGCTRAKADSRYPRLGLCIVAKY